MKIYIAFEILESASGGGNQFLKALKGQLVKRELYTNNIEDSDIVLFNSYQYIEQIVKIKKNHKDKIFVHRVDGPIRLYNAPTDKRDFITNAANTYLSDATIFQSDWSKNRCLEYGINDGKYQATIINAPDETVFYSDDSQKTSGKIKILSNSWSANINKGFETYQWLDDNLDFECFEYIFVGNSPVKFNNIKMIGPKSSKEISRLLRESNIYITASKKDPCSNSLIEAIHCGAFPIALNDGGHTEIVNGIGYTYDSCSQLLEILSAFNSENSELKNLLPKMNEVTDKYVDFFNFLIKEKDNDKLVLNRMSKWDELRVYLPILRNKLFLKFKL